jgi:hypothetical protein
LKTGTPGPKAAAHVFSFETNAASQEESASRTLETRISTKEFQKFNTVEADNWINMEDPMVGYYAHMIQGLFRMRMAQRICKNKILETYVKSLDPAYNCYYYYNTITGESSWVKPKLLGEDDLPEENAQLT